MPRYSKKRKAAVDAMVKEDIREAVSGILSRRRPERLTMELVAREAGMAKGTLYNYFKDKADLVAYVIADITKPYEERSERIAASDMATPEKLRAIAELKLRMSSEKGRLLSVMLKFTTQPFARQEAKESTRRDEKRIGKIMESGLREGVFRDIPAADLVTAYSGIVESFARRRLGKKNNGTVEEDAETVMRIFMGGASAQQA